MSTVSTSSATKHTRPSLIQFVESEQSFFRTWALRSSDRETPDYLSSTSSPVSPKTTVFGRAKRASNHAERSEAAHIPEDPRQDESRNSAPENITQGIFSEENPQLRLTKPSEAELPDPQDGRSSSMSRAQRLVPRHSRDASNSTGASAESPSRNAKDGYRWKRAISGHWFEIRIGRKRRKSDELLRTDTESTNPAVPNEIPTSNTPQVDALLPDTSTNSYKEGLYGRMKRRFGLIQDSSEPPSDGLSTESLTWGMLQRVSTLLREFSEKTSSPPPSSSASDSTHRISPGSIAGSQYGRLSHLLPCPRGPFSSSSSSLRNMRMVRPLQVTPEPLAMYMGSDSHQYFRVDMTDPDGPTFLPSEARRIGTPPLRDHNMRGFFFDLKAPASPGAEGVERDPCPARWRNGKKPCLGDWYKLKLEAQEAEDIRSQRFELDVPDHLPNSPLCPRNARHPSGGKGICVYHGRNKSIDRLE